MLEVLAGVRASAPADFADLARAVLAQRAGLTSCIVVLLSWDEARKNLVDALRRTGIELRVLLVAEIADAPPGVTLLHPGSIGAGLATLR
jgi:hypothetical protein